MGVATVTVWTNDQSPRALHGPLVGVEGLRAFAQPWRGGGWIVPESEIPTSLMK